MAEPWDFRTEAQSSSNSSGRSGIAVVFIFLNCYLLLLEMLLALAYRSGSKVKTSKISLSNRDDILKLLEVKCAQLFCKCRHLHCCWPVWFPVELLTTTHAAVCKNTANVVFTNNCVNSMLR